jgi:PAS domain S-box-containing protein
VANIAFAIYTAHLVYHSPLLPVSHLPAPFRLAAGASVFFIANTFPIAAVIALTERKSLRQVWSGCYVWSFPYYLVGAAIVGAFSFANRTLQWEAWLLILPVVYVIYRSYNLYLDRLETERNRAEEQSRHAEQIAVLHANTMEALASAVTANAKLDAVIQASPLAIVALDTRGNVTNWNATAERLFGVASEDALDRPLPLNGEQAEEKAQGIVHRTLCGEFLSGLELTERRKDGSTFEAALWTAPLRDPAGVISGIVATVADVSDRKRLEEQLNLSRKMEAVGRLAGGVAHDFNNLLTVINGYSAMLLEEVGENTYAASQVKEILHAGNRAADLVSQLLTFSRRQVIKPKPLEINQLVRDLERMLRRLIGEHIDFRTALDPDAGWIVADPNQMTAVLMNLATNARDAMPGGGILWIETAHAEAGSHGYDLEMPAGSYVRLIVRDTGHGMSAETQQHLFEPFFTTKERGKGTGLGLSSVYGGVEQSGGRIFVTSELGKGTSFSIYLPRVEYVGSPESRNAVSVMYSKGSETILLVEDELSVRRILREALRRAGYRVWEAGDGAEALELWGDKIGQVDLVVTDVVMPVMSGLKLAEELRSRRAHLKVLFMSGHAEEMLSSQGVVDGSLDLLSKPFVPKVLVSRVQEVLGRVAESVVTR